MNPGAWAGSGGGLSSDAAATVLDDLSRLADLVEADQCPAVAELIRRLADNRFRILVVGEAKRGKSTLVNALLGRELLPVGVVPVTSVSTTVTHGWPERLAVAYQDGRRCEAGLDRLGELVDERANPANRLGVEAVTAYVDAPIVRDGIELVDTPGAGSVYGHGDETRRALQTMDAAILVLTADPPLSASERDLLAEVARTAVRTFVVVNKADQLEPAEIETVVGFVGEQAASVLGAPPEVLVCSARAALRARLAGTPDPRSGVPALAAALSAYLAVERLAALQESVRRKADQLIGRTLDGLQIRLRLADLQSDEARRRTDDFAGHLDRVRRRRSEAGDLVRVGTGRLLAELNEAAVDAENQLSSRSLAATQAWLDGPGRALSPAELRQDGRAYAVDQIRAAVETWRLQRQELLIEGLRRLDERLVEGLATDLAEIADAAREVLGVDLGAEADRSRLVDNPEFSYQLGELIGWSELITASLRRRLGGRRQAVTELLAEVDRLSRQQVGRVRADLQARLQESGRALLHAVAERFAAATELLERALADAARDRETTAGHAQGVAAELQPRADQLMLLRGRLAAARVEP